MGIDGSGDMMGQYTVQFCAFLLKFLDGPSTLGSWPPDIGIDSGQFKKNGGIYSWTEWGYHGGYCRDINEILQQIFGCLLNLCFTIKRNRACTIKNSELANEWWRWMCLKRVCRRDKSMIWVEYWNLDEILSKYCRTRLHKGLKRPWPHLSGKHTMRKYSNSLGRI